MALLIRRSRSRNGMCLELRREPQTDPAAAAVGAVQHPVFLVKRFTTAMPACRLARSATFRGPFRTERVCEEA